MAQVYIGLAVGFVATMGSIALDCYRETVREQEARDMKALTAPLPAPRMSLLPEGWRAGRAARSAREPWTVKARPARW